MRLRAAILALMLLSLGTLASAQEAVTSDAILSQAKAQAATGHKSILLVFSASWCGPCHLFEGFLVDPTIQPIMDKAFAIGRLEVGERPTDKRHVNTPGGEDLKAALGGKDAGFPYIILLTATGQPIVNSVRPGGKSEGEQNIGYPDLPVEVDWFMQMLRKAAPSLSAQDMATIHDWLTAHSSSHKL